MTYQVLLQSACLLVVVGLLLTAAWQDLRTLHIANRLPLAIAVAFVIWSVLGLLAGTSTPQDILLSGGCAIGLLLAAGAAFAAGMMGGGDVKLAAATALFAGPAAMVDFLLVVAVAGGLLGLATLAGLLPFGAVAASREATFLDRLRSPLPYGPAIAAGGLWLVATLA